MDSLPFQHSSTRWAIGLTDNRCNQFRVTNVCTPFITSTFRGWDYLRLTAPILHGGTLPQAHEFYLFPLFLPLSFQLRAISRDNLLWYAPSYSFCLANDDSAVSLYTKETFNKASSNYPNCDNVTLPIRSVIVVYYYSLYHIILCDPSFFLGEKSRLRHLLNCSKGKFINITVKWKHFDAQIIWTIAKQFAFLWK